MTDITAILRQNIGKLYTHCLCEARGDKGTFSFHSSNCDHRSLFDLASVSKVITGTLVLQIVGCGHLSLSEKLSNIFTAAGPQTMHRFEAITVESLLTHSSGLPAWYPFYTQTGNFWDILENLLAKTPPHPGTLYSDINFMLLGEIILLISGKSLEQNLAVLNAQLGTAFTYGSLPADNCVPTEFGNRVEKSMCAQLGLSFTGWRDSSIQICGQPNDGNCHYFWHDKAGHAGVFGTAKDLLTLAQLYLNDGAINGKQLLPMELALSSFLNRGESRGLMWDLSDIFPHGFGHTGFTGTALWICPQKNLAAALLTSRLPLDGPPNLQDLRKNFFTALYQSF